jgi:VIT1/CCC1 family predicted Fe2+/Mn2+ transporter
MLAFVFVIRRSPQKRAYACENDAAVQLRTFQLAAIYVARGLTSDLATQVAEQLMAHDALGAAAFRK